MLWPIDRNQAAKNGSIFTGVPFNASYESRAYCFRKSPQILLAEEIPEGMRAGLTTGEKTKGL